MKKLICGAHWNPIDTFLTPRASKYVNSLRPSDAIWRQISGWTLAQVMACCLTAPSHYLNQCWVLNKVEWHSSKGNFTRDTSAINHWNYLKKIKYLKCHSNFPGANELNVFSILWRHNGITLDDYFYRVDDADQGDLLQSAQRGPSMSFRPGPCHPWRLLWPELHLNLSSTLPGSEPGVFRPGCNRRYVAQVFRSEPLFHPSHWTDNYFSGESLSWSAEVRHGDLLLQLA